MRKVKSSLWPICGTPPVWDCSGYRRSDRCASRSPSRSGAGPKTTSRGYNSLSAPDSEGPFEATNMKLQTILLSAALLSAATPAAAQDKPPVTGKFGFVNTERILRDATPAVKAQKKIEAEFQKRDQELAHAAEQLKKMQDELEKNSVTMSETQRRTKEREFGDLNRDFQRRQREFREDLNQRRNEELAQVVEQANRVIRQIAEQEKYDIIFQDAVFASPRIDITDKVIKALEGKPPAKWHAGAADARRDCLATRRARRGRSADPDQPGRLPGARRGRPDHLCFQPALQDEARDDARRGRDPGTRDGRPHHAAAHRLRASVRLLRAPVAALQSAHRPGAGRAPVGRRGADGAARGANLDPALLR